MEKKILVIDDDSMVTQAIGNLLEKANYSATASQDGYEALDKIIEERNFDLIVCDIRLPGINGVETVKRIKERLKALNKPDIPVIFITGYADEEVNAEAQKIGKLIYKPFDNKDFLKIIKEYIEEK
ncbi:MAG: response regulator [Candidatus Omnitrophica bacterium]|nr:response regulator [Candidatus Omnitrophota bacterium]